MNWMQFGILVLAPALAAGAAPSESRDSVAVESGFVPLFNGRDFSGWRVPEGDNGHWKVLDGVIDYDARSASSLVEARRAKTGGGPPGCAIADVGETASVPSVPGHPIDNVPMDNGASPTIAPGLQVVLFGGRDLSLKGLLPKSSCAPVGACLQAIEHVNC